MALTPIEYEILAEDEDALDLAEDAVSVGPSKTWRIDLETGRIMRYIDGEESIRQYIRKALMTPVNRYLIYDDVYGEELSDLLGQSLSKDLMDVEIPRVVRNAIENDDRIFEVTDVIVTQYSSDSIHISVSVTTVDGLFLTEEVAR